jgi:hypothetical protein
MQDSHLISSWVGDGCGDSNSLCRVDFIVFVRWTILPAQMSSIFDSMWCFEASAMRGEVNW